MVQKWTPNFRGKVSTILNELDEIGKCLHEKFSLALKCQIQNKISTVLIEHKKRRQWLSGHRMFT